MLVSHCFLISLMIGQTANINISQTNLFEGEPYLAVNPTNHQNIVIAWMALDASTGFKMAIKSKISIDGGNVWGNTFIQPHLAATYHSADVSMQFRNDGKLFLSYIDYRENPDSGGVYISNSTNGGVSWNVPSQVFSIFDDSPKKPIDRPWLSIDNSLQNSNGTLYITTKPPSTVVMPNRAYLKKSSNQGLAWSNFRYVDTTGYLIGNFIAEPMAVPATTADGALCVAYPSYVALQSVFPKMLLAKSYNQGQSFQYYDMIVNTTPLVASDSSYKRGYHLATNPQNANQMAFVFLDPSNGDPDVKICSSNDGGHTWSAPIRVNDDAIGNGIGQDLPWISYGNNKLVATWRDRRNGIGIGFAQNTDVYYAVSINNGLSFSANQKLNDLTATYNNILLQNGNDFMSCELVADTLYAAWGDTRTGNLNIFFAKSNINNATTQIIKSIADETINIYPNPANEKLFVRANTKQITMLEIFDTNAKLLITEKISNTDNIFEIGINQLPNGIYFLKIRNERNEYFHSQKIVIKHQ
jgi:Secretion system C-terminal sorting domain